MEALKAIYICLYIYRYLALPYGCGHNLSQLQEFETERDKRGLDFIQLGILAGARCMC